MTREQAAETKMIDLVLNRPSAADYRAAQLDMYAAAIRSAEGLYALRDALIAFDDLCREQVIDEKTGLDDDSALDTENELCGRGLDLTSLPMFGGREPKSTIEVWSWDEDYLLVGVGPCHDWTIVDRTAKNA